MAPPPAHGAATANPADEYTPPRDARAPDSPGEIPPSAPSGLRQNAWARSRTCTQPVPQLESAPVWASSPLDRAGQYSIPQPTCAAPAHRARRRQEPRPPPTSKSLQSAAGSRKYRWQSAHNGGPQTTAASSSSRPHVPWRPPTAASAHTSPAAWEQLRRADGSFDSDPARSATRLYRMWAPLAFRPSEKQRRRGTSPAR